MIRATNGADTIEAGRGDDDIAGFEGNDTYIFRRGDGKDVIEDSSGTDVLKIFGYSASDISVRRPVAGRNDILIRFNESDDEITLRYDYGQTGVETIRFADGTVLTSTQLFAMTVGVGTDFDDEISGSPGADVIEGGKGNDYLHGGSGADTYVFHRGDGRDEILDFNYSGPADKLLLPDHLPGDAKIFAVEGQRYYANDAILQLGNGDQIILRDALGDSPNGLTRIQFANGVTWDAAQIAARVEASTVPFGEHHINGTSGSDVLSGTLADDIYIGGAGNDSLIYNRGGGRDVIKTYHPAYSNDSLDIRGYNLSDAKFYLAPNNRNDLVIRFNGTEDEILITDAFSVYVNYVLVNGQYVPQERHGVEIFKFDDLTLNYSQLLARVLSNLTSAGSDVVNAPSGGNQLTLQPGLGNDIIQTVDQTIKFTRGDGFDYFDTTARYNTLKLFGYAPSEVKVKLVPNGDGFDISFVGTNDHIEAARSDSYWTGYSSLSSIQFENGVVWDSATLLSKATAASNTAVTANNKSQVLDFSQAGTDLSGLGGDDYLVVDGYPGQTRTVHYGLGDGLDTVAFNYFNPWTLDLAGLNPADIRVLLTDGEATSGDLFVQIAGTSDGIWVRGGLQGLLGIDFANSDHWTHSDIVAAMEVFAQPASEAKTIFVNGLPKTITSTTADERFIELTVDEARGNTHYVYQLGGGHDFIDNAAWHYGIEHLDTVDTLTLTDIASTDFTAWYDTETYDLQLRFNVNDSLTLARGHTYAYTYRSAIDAITFSDGITLTREQIAATAQPIVVEPDPNQRTYTSGDFVFDRTIDQGDFFRAFEFDYVNDRQHTLQLVDVLPSELTVSEDGYGWIYTIAGRAADGHDVSHIYVPFGTNAGVMLDGNQFIDGSMIRAMLDTGLAAPSDSGGREYYDLATLERGVDSGLLLFFGHDNSTTLRSFDSFSNNPILNQLAILGVAQSDLSVVRSSSGIYLKIAASAAGQTDDMTVWLNDFAQDDRLRIYLDNDVVLSFSDLLELLPVPSEEFFDGTSGNDHLTIYTDEQGAPVTINAAGGDDKVVVNSDNVKLVYARGDGNDIYFIQQPPNTASMSVDIELHNVDPAKAHFLRHGNDLLLRIDSSAQGLNDSGFIRMMNLYVGTVSSVSFDGGVVWDSLELRRQVAAMWASDGDDVFTSDLGLSYFELGKGNDFAYSERTDTTYVYNNGDGFDRYSDNGQAGDGYGDFGITYGTGSDVLLLKGLTPADVSFQAMGDNLVITIKADPARGIEAGRIIFEGNYLNTRFNHKIELVKFDNGVELTSDQISALIIAPQVSAGHDKINGTGHADVIAAGTGDDVITGNGGGDTYVWSRGDGHDEIFEASDEALSSYVSAPDRLKLMGVDPSHVTFERSTRGLLVRISESGAGLGDGGSILVVGQMVEGEEAGTGIELVEFGNGSSKTISEIASGILAAQATIFGDRLVGSSVAETLVGGRGDDLLQGGYGGDTYVYNRGDGEDRIFDSEDNYYYSGRDDSLVLHGITAETVLLQRGFEDDLEIVIGPSAAGMLDGGRITVRNGLEKYTGVGIEKIIFDDGTIWLRADFESHIQLNAATHGNDLIVGSSGADTIAGLGGNDLLRGGGGDDTYVYTRGDGADTIEDVGYSTGDKIVINGYTASQLTFTRVGSTGLDLIIRMAETGDEITVIGGLGPNNNEQVEFVVLADSNTTLTLAEIRNLVLQSAATAGDDLVLGTDQDDVLLAGTGNDMISGGNGQDSYIYRRGDGDDRITDKSGYADKVILTNYNVADIAFAVRGGPDSSDFVIRFTGERDRLVLVGALSDNPDGIESIQFADGTIWTLEQMRARALADVDSANNDNVYGFDGADTFNAKTGNDLMAGGEGSDVYRFTRGKGHDTVDDTGLFASDTDAVVFLDYVSTEVSVQRLFRGSSTVVLHFASSNSDTLTVVDALVAGKKSIESYTFSDGVTWTREMVLTLLDNRAPVATNDGYFTAVTGEPTIILASVLLRNDFDADGDTLRIIAVDGGESGTAQLNAAGDVVFTANPGFNGATHFTYTISDGRAGITQAQVDVRVRPIAQARDDVGYSVDEDQFLVIKSSRLLSNDLDGDRMVIGEVFGAVNGTVSISSTGDITFTPTPNFSGTAQFTYAANTPEGGRAEATVTIQVNSVNDAPTAVTDTGYVTQEDVPFQISTAALLFNDMDVDGDSLRVVSVQSNANVQVALTADGYVIATPRAFYFGSAYFEYTVQDSAGATSVGRVNFTVTPVNNAPELHEDLITTDEGLPILEDNPVVISFAQLLANDFERDGETMQIIDISRVVGGRAEVQPNNTIVFTPFANFNGDARFTYTVTDGQGGVSEAVATIRFQSVNDRPTVRDDHYVERELSILKGFEDRAIEIPISELMKNDTDVEGLGLQFHSIGNALHGDVVVTDHGTIIFTPDPDYWGEATFSYLVSDPDGAVDDATVTLWFENVGDAPPVAVRDEIVIYEDVPRVISIAALLGNDTDIDLDHITFAGWRYLNNNDPESYESDFNGVITVLANGDLLFTPDANKFTSSGIKYRVTDGNPAPGGGLSNWGYIDFIMIPIDDDPTATNDDGGSTPLDVPLVLRVSSLLANDFDVDDDGDNDEERSEKFTFTGVASVSAGTAEVVEADGEKFIIVRFPTGFTGAVTVEYLITDSTGYTDSGFVSATVEAGYSRTLTGTPQTDWLEGNNFNETINGLGDSDTIRAMGGNDIVNGGDGDDVIDAGDGDDIINGGDGADRINGGDGRDVVNFAGSNTWVRADLASRIGQGGTAQGDIYGNIEDLIGTEFGDSLGGDEKTNRLEGRDGNDLLEGRAGNDELIGAAGDDVIEGGAGADLVDGGAGSDTADYFLSEAGVTVSLANGTASGGDATGDQLVSIENLTGSDFEDTLEGNAADNTLYGRRGNDVLLGGAGNDTLIGGQGADSLQGGDGIDVADYGFSASGVVVDLANTMASSGDAQGDTYSSIEIIQGSNANDSLLGDGADNRLRGADGADVLDGRGGFDTADYSTSDGPVTINLTNGTGQGADAQGDTLISIEHVIGSGFADHLIGSSGNDSFEGGYGNDLQEGGFGSDRYGFGFDSKEDVITENGATSDVDRVVLGSAIAPKDISLIRVGDNLLIELEKDGGYLIDTVLVTDHFVGNEKGIEEIVFIDGTIWDRAQIETMARTGRFNADDDIYRLGFEDEVATIDPSKLLLNDATEGRDQLHIISVGNSQHGSAWIGADGKIHFLGDLNFNGDAFFDYTVRDQFGRESTATVEVNLAPVNDAPEAHNDGPIHGTEDVVLYIQFAALLANDFDIDGDELTIVDVKPLLGDNGSFLYPDIKNTGTNGETKIDFATDTIEFKSVADHFGFAGFTYTVRDAGGLESTASVELYIDPVNDGPRSASDKRTIRMDSTTSISLASLLANDFDIEGDAFTFQGFHTATNGSFMFDQATGLLNFTPNALGKASFQYDLLDARGARSTIDVELNVIPLNDPPDARNDSGFSTLEDHVIIINVADLLTNDSDPNGDSIFISSVERFPLNGKAVLWGDGTIHFIPRTDYNGNAGFKYTISDGRGGFDTAFVSINIVPDNDGPQLRDDLIHATEDQPIIVIPGLAFGNDMDPDGDVLFFDSVSVIGVIDQDFSHRTNFAEELEFAAGGTPEGVTAVATLSDGTSLPTWLSFDAQTLKFTGTAPVETTGPVTVAVTFTHIDGQGHATTLTRGMSFDAHATGLATGLAFDSGVATLKTGVGSFGAVLSNGRALPYWLGFDSETMQLGFTELTPDENAHVEHVRIHFAPTPVTLPDGTYSSSDGGFSLEFTVDPTQAIDPAINALLSNMAFFASQGMFGIDLGAAQSVTALTENKGSLPSWLHFNAETLQFEGTPPAEYVGALPVRLDVVGNGSTLPTFSIIRDVIVDQTFTVNAVADPDGLSAHVVNNRITVGTPEDFNGSLALFYGANDGKGGVSSHPAVIVVNVMPMPEKPDALDDELTATEDQTSTYLLSDLLANDKDDDGDVFHVININQPTHGTLTVNLSTIAINLAASLGAPAGATYTVTLQDGSALPAWLTLDAATGLLSGTVPLDVLAQFNFAVTAQLDGNSWSGTVGQSINGNTGVTLTYVPNAAYSGEDTFSYVITDNKQGNGTGLVKIDVAPVNDPPVAVKDYVNMLEGEVKTISFTELLANDYDVDGDPMTITSVLNASHGTVSIQSGQIIFVADDNFDGKAGFDYVVTDGTNGSSTGHVEVNVASTNHAPVAVTDNIAAVEDTPITISIASLLANDTDFDGDNFSFVSIQESVVGARTFMKPGGLIQFVPNENVNGPITFNYTITDGRLSTTGHVVVNFAAVNDAPIVITDGPFFTSEDTSITIDLATLLANDVDVEADSFTITSVFDGDNGAVVMNGTTAVFTPRTNHFGNAGFSYRVVDSGGATSVGYVNITVTPEFDLPIAVSDAGFTVQEDGFIDFDPAVLMSNDVDPDGLGLIFMGFQSPLEHLANGLYRYTPSADYFGNVTLTYGITNASNVTVTTTVNLNVINTPDAPVAVDDELNMVEDTPFTFNISQLLANDIDVDLDAKIFSRVVSSTGVTVVDNGNGSLSLTTIPNAAGYASFVYEMKDSTGLTSTATVGITIANVNDAPVIGTPPAFLGTEDTGFSLTLNPNLFSDPDGQAVLPGLRSAGGGPLPNWLHFSLQTLTVSGQPPLNFNGSIALELTADDGQVITVKPVTLTIAPVNDAPVIADVPVLQAAQLSPISYVLPAALFTDVDGDAIQVTVQGANGAALPSWLTFDSATRTLAGTPPASFSGQLTLQVSASDGSLTTVKPWQVNVAVSNNPPTIGTLPVVTVLEDKPISVQLNANLFADVDGNPISVAVLGANGAALPAWLSFNAATRTLTGTPPANFNGVIELTVAASDGVATTVKPWALTVTPVNDAPTIGTLPTVTTPEDVRISITLDPTLFADVDGDNLTINVRKSNGAALPTWLTFDPVTRTLTGTPPANFNGAVNLQVTVSDGTSVTVKPWTLTVSPVNDVPVARNDAYNAGTATHIVIPLSQLLANDTDPDGNSLTVVSVTGGVGYTAVLDGLGNVVIDRANGTSGVLNVGYVISDGATTATAVLKVTVVSVNQAPVVAVIDPLHSAEDAPVNITLPASLFSDPNGDNLTYTVRRAGGTALPSWLTFNAQTLQLTGTPPANFNGTLALQILVSDGLLSTTRTFDLVVDPVNDLPVLAAPLSDRFVIEDKPFTFKLQNNLVTDVDGDPLTYTLKMNDGSAAPSWINFDAATLTISGTPPLNYFGATQLRLFITDGTGTISDDFAFTVTNVNDAPVVSRPLLDQNLTTGTAFTITLPTDAFTDPDGTPLQYAAKLSSGAALPSWMTFNGTALTGTAPASGTWSIKILASDGTLQVSDDFNITFSGGNSAPVAVRDTGFATRSGVPIEIIAAQLAANDTDADNDHLTVVQVRDAANGSVSLVNGIVTYTSNAGFSGTDSFIYKVSDGVRTSEALVVVNVAAPPTLSLHAGNDGSILFGGTGSDYVNGGNGADVLFGGAGNDSIFGGNGNDQLNGDAGNDLLYGGAGADSLFGGAGSDRLHGGTGNDQMTGGAGADSFLFRQGDGSDTIADFSAGQSDRIIINMQGVSNFDDLLAIGQQQAGGVLFAFANGDELFLAGTQLAALDRNSFTFY